ncbi:MBL fold metallo-hydrolase [Fluviibacterium sp. S390]|uniref:MBL fold metallo-hydrolase n=1 Tax=Fluviibacterium sp. S390 TaxID=3415139 RepID=UPI003C7CF8B5
MTQRPKRRLTALAAALATLGMAQLPSLAEADSVTATGTDMVVTLLGTGTPAPVLTRFGYSTLVSAGGHLLLFDIGRGATQRLWQVGLLPGDVDEVFVTHYHSDHVIGLPDLWLTSWLVPYGANSEPFRITGPTGLSKLTEGLTMAYGDDIRIRVADQNLPAAGVAFDLNEFSEDGVVFDKDGVTVTAFTVNHGEKIKPAVGYRIDYAGHSVVLSGDTRKDNAVIDAATGADLLVHQVAMAAQAIADSPPIKAIMGHHTLPNEAGEVFASAEPGLAVFSHFVLLGPPGAAPTASDVLALTRTTYDGPLEIGEDLMTITIGDEIRVGTADTR